MKKFFNACLLSLAIIGLFTMCSSDRLKDADISNVKSEPVKLLRLENDVFVTNPDSFQANAAKMRTKYHSFYNSFIFNIVNHGEERDSVYKALKLFVSDADMKQVYQMVKQAYPDAQIENLENELTKSFTYFKYHFPNAEMPRQYVTCMSGFNYSITTTDTTLGISLDMYLGAQNKYYEMLQWPKYKVRFLSKEYIVSDAMRWWIIHCFDKSESINNLLNHMIFHGKMYYALDVVLPFTEDSVKIQYTGKQMDYYNQYKKNLWAHFAEKDRLYKNDLKELAPYVAEGPFTTAISKECPPRIATYIGWQIVRAYMNKNPDITLQQLMEEKDAQKILTKSKYKP
ncbi:MAG TPA: hypothetical protein VNZ49_11745 [Bacteroidia bacterium]|jgi:hypothetical protein|nr:hypothetical protein [Bacteroidia bacterium]